MDLLEKKTKWSSSSKISFSKQKNISLQKDMEYFFVQFCVLSKKLWTVFSKCFQDSFSELLI